MVQGQSGAWSPARRARGVSLLAGWAPFSTSLGPSAPSLRRGGGIGNPRFPHGGLTVGSSDASCPRRVTLGRLLAHPGGVWGSIFLFKLHYSDIFCHVS